MKKIIFIATWVICLCFSVSTFGQKIISADEYIYDIPVYKPGEIKKASQEETPLKPKSLTTSAIVPSLNYPTIQSAVFNGVREIVILPGIYYENIIIPNYGFTYTFRAKTAGTVIIDGGTSGNTFSLNIQASARWENLTIINSQLRENYDTAAIFGWGGVKFDVRNCIIYTKSIGLSSSYGFWTSVINSKITGLSPKTLGLTITYQDGTAFAWENYFSNLHIGINARNLSRVVQPINRCQASGCPETNLYERVTHNYLE